MKNELVAKAMTIKLDNTLPEYPKMEEGYRRAPDRGFRLTPAPVSYTHLTLPTT